METNIKKNYQKSTAGDGTITLKFNQQVNPLLIIGIIAGIFVISGIIFTVTRLPFFLIYFVIFLISFPWLAKLRQGVIVIKPNSGIIVRSRQIAFKDIRRFTVHYVTNAFGIKFSSVIAEVHGSDIPVTKTLTNHALAAALVNEMTEASGKSWDDLR